MRTIRVAIFQCEKCGAEYENRKDAEKCEAMPIEKKAFQRGDIVRPNTKWQCGRCNKWVRLTGKIVLIEWPQPADEDYEHRRIQKPGRIGTHVYFYGVKANCPNKCGNVLHPAGYAPEFTLVRKKRKK